MGHFGYLYVAIHITLSLLIVNFIKLIDEDTMKIEIFFKLSEKYSPGWKSSPRPFFLIFLYLFFQLLEVYSVALFMCQTRCHCQ